MTQQIEEGQIVYRFSTGMYPKIEEWKVTGLTPEVTSFEYQHSKITRNTETVNSYIDNIAYLYNSFYTTKQKCIEGIEAHSVLMKNNYIKKQQQMQGKIDRINDYLTNIKLKNK